MRSASRHNDSAAIHAVLSGTHSRGFSQALTVLPSTAARRPNSAVDMPNISRYMRRSGFDLVHVNPSTTSAMRTSPDKNHAKTGKARPSLLAPKPLPRPEN